MAESISGSAIAATVVGIVVGSAAAFNYDGRGNPTEVIDSATAIAGQSDTTRYSWDGKFDQLTSIVPPERDSTVFSVDVNNGNRLWQQPGADLTRRVLFDYYSSGNGAGMVRATELPGGARDSVIYDAMGNAIELKLLWASGRDSKGTVSVATR